MDAKERKAVVVTTAHRGIFFGYMVGPDPKDGILALEQVRNCLYFDRSIMGFIGLAVTGPDVKCRVGPAGESMTLYGVTSIIGATEAATKAWEASPWSA